MTYCNFEYRRAPRWQQIAAAVQAAGDPAVADPEVSDPEVIQIPEIDEPGSGHGNFRVILYNDDFHSFDEVIEQVLIATSYPLSKVQAIVMEAHTRGRAICYHGSRERCHQVVGVLRQIRLQCEVDSD